MRATEKTIVYELTPEERQDTTLEDEILREIHDGWNLVSMSDKNLMQFDANYNRYYARVKYER